MQAKIKNPKLFFAEFSNLISSLTEVKLFKADGHENRILLNLQQNLQTKIETE